MFSFLKKNILNLLILLSISQPCLAGPIITAPASIQKSPAQSNDPANSAIDFAKEAGVVAGVAKACGADISLFNQRAQEVINVLSPEVINQQMAYVVYQQMLSETETKEKQTQAVECSKALQAYTTVPLLQNDYKEKVIGVLSQQSSSSPTPSS